MNISARATILRANALYLLLGNPRLQRSLAARSPLTLRPLNGIRL
jgi:hypothetical protein